MTQLEFQFGDWIDHETGPKPHWLEEGERVLAETKTTLFKVTVGVDPLNWYVVERFRVRADHAYYTRPSVPPPPSPAEIAASNEPPFWALNRASEEIGNLVTPATALTALARYIARHETAPVDPDVLAMREILATWLTFSAIGTPKFIGDMRNGDYDEDAAFQRTVEVYRTLTSGGVVDVPSS